VGQAVRAGAVGLLYAACLFGCANGARTPAAPAPPQQEAQHPNASGQLAAARELLLRAEQEVLWFRDRARSTPDPEDRRRLEKHIFVMSRLLAYTYDGAASNAHRAGDEAMALYFSERSAHWYGIASPRKEVEKRLFPEMKPTAD